jgi:myo-inositol-1(or 4)-monophosphatase
MGMENYLTKAIEIAREAGALLLQMARRPLDIAYKHPADLVTEADRSSERLIIERLRQHFPNHDVVSEEGGGQRGNAEYCWYVDPLDGTTNYAHGFPVFSVAMGLTYKGEVIAGVVYDPSRDELFSAERGAGAFLNHEPIRVSRTTTLAASLLGTGFPPYAGDHSLNIEFYYRLTRISHGVRRAGSAALDLCSVAAGRFDGFWELKLNPWDKAAGSLLVTEAGGRVTHVTGAELNLLGDDILASNGLIHEEMRKEFAEVAARHREQASGRARER